MNRGIYACEIAEIPASAAQHPVEMLESQW